MTDGGAALPRVRRATRADGSQYAVSLQAAAADAGWSLAQIEACFDAARCEIWIAEDRAGPHPLLGYLAVRAVLDELEVLSLAVLPAERRRGLGRHLLGSVLDAWRTRGVRRVFLEVRATNTPARRLYEGLGFVEVGRRSRYYADGEDAVVMRWPEQKAGKITTLGAAENGSAGESASEEDRGKRGHGADGAGR